MAIAVVAIVAGLLVLAVAADRFVVGAARLAVTFRVSPVVVGVTVIGFGTSAPELVVSGIAAARGGLDIAVGNLVGSNLANVSLVLGVAGLLAAPAVRSRIVRREAPLSVAAVALFAVLIQGGLSRLEGLVLVAGMVVAIVVVLGGARRQAAADADDLLQEVGEVLHAGNGDRSGVPGDTLLTAAGLIGTVVGAYVLVTGAEGVIDALDLSGGFVGLTVVALGTSLPELVTAVQSARRGQVALLAGNVLGSNIFNSLGGGGLVALVGPGVLADAGLTVVAAGLMVVVVLLSWVFLAGGALRRWEGALLLVAYAVALPFMKG
ncbi:MAG: calcium/sodium antiporter [Actinobacteria bacterium]|nr:calcium/sodium antiporter [Actinomycetota bacterium]